MAPADWLTIVVGNCAVQRDLLRLDRDRRDMEAYGLCLTPALGVNRENMYLTREMLPEEDRVKGTCLAFQESR